MRNGGVPVLVTEARPLAGSTSKAASKVPAAENTLRILKLLASRRGPMAASQIASSLGLPRSSVY
ncbi:MAG TPA: helix-turn-helix domain-containing protein, partial [Arthrobacter sp.]